MNRLELIQRVRAHTRDFSNSIFRESDITSFINEGIQRFRQAIPELKGLQRLLANTHEPTLIPEEYHHLLALYTASRCFAQDERHYQATTLMNEFEVKLEEFKSKVEDGSIKIIDPATGNAVVVDNDVDYVNLKPYWIKRDRDFDLGVEGVR